MITIDVVAGFLAPVPRNRIWTTACAFCLTTTTMADFLWLFYAKLKNSRGKRRIMMRSRRKSCRGGNSLINPRWVYRIRLLSFYVSVTIPVCLRYNMNNNYFLIPVSTVSFFIRKLFSLRWKKIICFYNTNFWFRWTTCCYSPQTATLAWVVPSSKRPPRCLTTAVLPTAWTPPISSQ